MKILSTADAEVISDLDLLAFPDSWWAPKTIESLLKTGWGAGYEENGQVVGYVLAIFDHELCDIVRVGVHPDHRNKGVAKSLVRAALEAVAGPTMLTVQNQNFPALHVYRKCGFRPYSMIEDHTIFMWQPEWELTSAQSQ